MKPLTKNGDLQLLIQPDGACAPSSGAAHLFHDQQQGPQFRMMINHHMVRNWSFYQDKINYPHIRKVGATGKRQV